MKTLIIIAVAIPVIILLMLLINFPVMWSGNRFLVDVGLETADYWSWFWVTFIFGLVFGGSSSSKRS